MKTIFRYRLARLRGQILGWGIGLALYALLITRFYDTIVGQQEQFEKLLENYPQELMAFFGGLEEFATPAGYLGIEFFSYMPLILGIFVVLMGSGLLASDEENGRLDLIMAHPVSRTALLTGRLAAFVVATLAILALVWLGLAVPSRWTMLREVSLVEMAQPFFSLLGVSLFMGVLAFLLSLLLPSRRMAAMTAGLLLIGNFFLVGLARIDAGLEPIAKVSPLYHYQGGEAIDGLNVTWVIGLLAGAALFAILAWWRFQQRDIRVGGEGGWQRPTLSSLSRWLPRRSAIEREALAPEGR